MRYGTRVKVSKIEGAGSARQLQLDRIIRRVRQILLGAKVPFRRLDR
jgi:hypothetical protein